MGISHQIEAVYQRALQLRQRAITSPVQKDLLDEALGELYFVLEELHTADEELQHQNQALVAARQQAAVEHQRYQTLFDLAPDGFLVTNRQGRILQVNQAAAALFSMPPAHLVNKPLIVLIDAAERPQFEANLARPGHRQNWPITITRRHQPPRSVTITTSRLKRFQGEDSAILWSLRDLSHPQAPGHSPEPETNRVAPFTTLAEAAEPRTTPSAYLATEAPALNQTLTHKLNDALTPIVTASELLLLPEYGLSPSAQALVTLVQTSTQYLTQLSQGHLASRPGEDEQIPLALGKTLAAVMEAIKLIAPDSIQLNANFSTDRADFVEANPAQIYQVFLNLCLNACDAMVDGGTLTLTVDTRSVASTDLPLGSKAEAGSYIVTTVADTGQGIDPLLIDRIFDPLAAAPASPPASEMGLAMVFRVVHNHGGFMQISSQKQAGTQFQIYLPALSPPAPEPLSDITLPSTDLPHGQGQCVLIVEANPTIGQTTQILLETYGYTTLIATSGVEALAVYNRRQNQPTAPPVAVVLLDIATPELEGLATLQTLRAIDPLVCVVAISGSATDGHQALASGARAFLSKPYKRPEILATLSQLVPSQHQPGHPQRYTNNE